MSDDGTIGSDHPLTEPQRRTLDALLNAMIPPSEDGAMPGAGDIGLLEPGGDNDGLVQAAAALLPALAEIGDDDGGMAALTPDARQAAMDRLAANHGAEFQQLVMQTLIFYYRNDRVLEGLGLEPGPPFPRGNTIEPGDLSLLDPVRKRGPLYRE